ncbi:MAG: ABC transporter permease [Methanomicrobiales archaeon]|nr:ABC transporter permease [Methanomicrobiales archaeon]
MSYSPEYLASDVKGAWAIAKKDLEIYYVKPNIYISGILFPLFMLLAFAVGRAAPLVSLVPGLIAITALFSASSIEPVSVPIERRTRTFDRLLSAPVSMFSIVLGESISGFMFSGSICFLLFIPGVILYQPALISIAILVLGIILSCFAFASFGTVFAAYPTENVGEVMSLLNLIRLPLIFISGVFIPLESMPLWGQTVAIISPLTYASDILRFGFEGTTHFGPWTDLLMLVVFAIIFQVLGNFLYRKFNI